MGMNNDFFGNVLHWNSEVEPSLKVIQKKYIRKKNI